jgi:branched-chain amino acid transport system permease protein
MKADTHIRPVYRVSHGDRSSVVGLVIWSLLTLVLVLAPLWASRDLLRLLTEVYSFLALASLWNLMAGYAGLVSVGQQAYVGIGGYTLFVFALTFGLNPLWGIAAAGFIGALLSVPIAFILFRLRGAYFTIGSWVIAEAFPYIFSQVASVGGGSGMSLPARVVKAIASSRDGREFLIYWLFLALTLVVIGLILLLLRTRYGLALTAIRDNEIAAKSSGIDVYRTRLVVFVVSAFGTAMMGSMIFLQKLSITPFVAFSMNNWTVNMIFIVVIGGIGRVEGPIVGTIIFFVLRQMLADYGSVYLILFGVVAIAVMLKYPHGLWGYFADRYGWQLFPLARKLERDSGRGA